MACLKLGVLLVCCVAFSGVVTAYIPEHVKRQLMSPDHDATSRFTQQHVAYTDPHSEKHLMLDYQAQQHLHVQLWSLDTIEGLQHAVLHDGEFTNFLLVQFGADFPSVPVLNVQYTAYQSCLDYNSRKGPS